MSFVEMLWKYYNKAKGFFDIKKKVTCLSINKEFKLQLLGY